MRYQRKGSLSDRVWARVLRTDGCELWEGATNAKGYGVIGVGKRTALVHRLVWTWANGSIPAGQLVLHRCDTPACVRVDHLFLGTPAANSRDMVEKGRGRGAEGTANGRTTQPERTARGERVGSARLTSDLVRQLRSRYATGAVSQRAIAREFGLPKSTVAAVLSGSLWTHVQ